MTNNCETKSQTSKCDLIFQDCQAREIELQLQLLVFVTSSLRMTGSTPKNGFIHEPAEQKRNGTKQNTTSQEMHVEANRSGNATREESSRKLQSERAQPAHNRAPPAHTRRWHLGCNTQNIAVSRNRVSKIQIRKQARASMIQSDLL